MSSLPRTDRAFRFTSPPPRVRLVHAFERPFENVVATARTCYSAKGIITEDQASARPERRDALAKSIYAAGHHTTFQHAHFQFALENVSRQFLWSFLHSHPFYNSEQVSQRYVEVRPDFFAIPPLDGEALAIYTGSLERQQAAYRKILEEPLPLEATPEGEHFESHRAHGAFAGEFAAEFDRSLGGYTSRLVDAKPGNQAQVAQAVREVLGLPRARLSDEDAIRLALDPAANRLHGEAMNVTSLSKLS